MKVSLENRPECVQRDWANEETRAALILARKRKRVRPEKKGTFGRSVMFEIKVADVLKYNPKRGWSGSGFRSHYYHATKGWRNRAITPAHLRAGKVGA